MWSDLFKILPFIRPGQEGFSGSFCNVTCYLTAHKWCRERELGSQQAVEGQPNVSCRACLVNFPAYPVSTRSPPGAAQLMRQASLSEPAKSPTYLPPTKFILICYSHALKGPVPAYWHPCQPLCVHNTYLTLELVGESNTMPFLEAPSLTSDHKFKNFVYTKQKRFQYQVDLFSA